MTTLAAMQQGKHVQIQCTNFSSNAFSVAGPRDWKELSADLKTAGLVI